ncbi:hypothetical protein NDA18_002088 [Ustilago nuda]|nr:hypothetical protein NDA18_002088 [Ustilago nuda]
MMNSKLRFWNMPSCAAPLSFSPSTHSSHPTPLHRCSLRLRSRYTVERINIASGEVCQEETIGDYATFVNIADGQPEKGNEPVFDYKMKDIHYVLLPQLADYLLRYNATSASDAATESLPRRALLQNGTAYRELLYANVEYVLNSSAAFVQDPSDHKNLARIKADNPVGNWRDSNISLGWGVYPVDVSTALVPAALYAISDTAKARLMQNFTSKSTNITETDLAETAERYATVWEQEAPKFFQYNVAADQAQERLQGYVQRANLSDSLLYGLGSLNGSSSYATSSNSSNSACAGGMQRHWGGVTFGREAEFSLLTPRQEANDTGSGSNESNSNTVAANQTTILYGLSLLKDSTVDPVTNSDLSFNLLYSRRPSRFLIQSVITALQP